VAVGSAKRAVAVLTSVASGTPADTAGLRAGDSVTEINGESVDGSLSLVAQVGEHSVGHKVTLKIVRDAQTRTLNVTLTSKPTTGQ
jgi:S1-C subfamily serine protease